MARKKKIFYECINAKLHGLNQFDESNKAPSMPSSVNKHYLCRNIKFNALCRKIISFTINGHLLYYRDVLTIRMHTFTKVLRPLIYL